MRGQRERGIVLIAVLLAVAIMSVMVVAVTSLARSGIARERVEARLLATRFALQSGVESGKALILTASPQQRVHFNGTPQVLDLGEGVRLEVAIRDAAGLVDLNRSDMQLLTSLLADNLGGPGAQTLAGSIAQWRKEVAPDTQPGAPQQAPAQAQASAALPASGQPPGQARLVFVAADQLLPLIGPEHAEDLARLVTVFNPTGLVNPLAAPDEVLMSVPGIAPGDVAIIKRARAERAPQSDQRIRQVLDRLKGFLAIQDASVFVIGVRLLDGDGIIPRSMAQAVVLLTENGRQPFRTLSVTGL